MYCYVSVAKKCTKTRYHLHIEDESKDKHETGNCEVHPLYVSDCFWTVFCVIEKYVASKEWCHCCSDSIQRLGKIDSHFCVSRRTAYYKVRVNTSPQLLAMTISYPSNKDLRQSPRLQAHYQSQISKRKSLRTTYTGDMAMRGAIQDRKEIIPRWRPLCKSSDGESNWRGPKTREGMPFWQSQHVTKVLWNPSRTTGCLPGRLRPGKRTYKEITYPKYAACRPEDLARVIPSVTWKCLLRVSNRP